MQHFIQSGSEISYPDYEVWWRAILENVIFFIVVLVFIMVGAWDNTRMSSFFSGLRKGHFVKKKKEKKIHVDDR